MISACGRDQTPPPPAPDLTPEAVEPVEIEPPTAETALRPIDASDLPPLLDDGALAGAEASGDRWASLRQALERNRRWLSGRPAGRRLQVGPYRTSIRQALETTQEILTLLDEDPSPERFGAELAQRFAWVESIGGESGQVLVTGYYEPILDASLSRRDGYSTPIFGPPGGVVRADLGAFADDLSGRRIAGFVRGGRLVPMPTRGELWRDRGPLAGREIAWARDRVDLFFLEIQGSGTLRLPDGSTRRVGYAASNGRPYRSIGKLLIDEGEIPRERMSMQALRRWLRQHPAEVGRVLEHNASVVFFRFLDGPPVGNLGVPVTPGRSIAVDQSLMPPGGIAFLDTERARATDDGTRTVDGTLRRLVVMQDTGGAIRGAGRVDFFWGRGDEAANRAGAMQQPGRLLVLVPRGAVHDTMSGPANDPDAAAARSTG